MFRRASLLSSAKPSSSLPFSLSFSWPYAPNTLLSVSPPPSHVFPVLAFASVKTKTYSRAGTDATMQFRAAMYLAFWTSGAFSVGAQATTNVTKFGLIEIRAFRRRALMHSIVMPSLPAFLAIFSFIANPTPCCHFLPLTMLQSPLKKIRYPAEISEVPSLLVSCNPMTSQPFAAPVLSRVSMCLIPLTPSTAAVRTLNVPNVRSSSRDLALVAFWFLRTDFLSARFPRRFFRANALRLSLSSSRCFLPRFLPSFFRRFGCGNPTTPRLRHRRHCRLLACALREFLISSLRVPRFPRRRCPNFADGCRGKRFRFVGVHRRQLMPLAGLHCQHRRVLESIDIMKEH